jgi:hypothetical protein
MPAPNDHPIAPQRRDRPAAELPQSRGGDQLGNGDDDGDESALDQALREVLAENAAAAARALAAGATPETLVAEAENDTTPSELDLTGTPTRPAPGSAASAPGERDGSGDDRREPMVVEALLLQVPGVDPLTVFKLTAAGLNRFAPLLRSSATELAAQAGLPLATAKEILAHLAHWKDGLTTPPPGGEVQAAAWRSLQPLLAALESSNAAVERAASGWSREQVSARRQQRQERDRVYMSIKAALASVGELDLLLRLEKLSFARRIDELHRLLRAGAAAGVLKSGPKGPMGDTPNGRTHP